ncbi:MAG: hypothetical protein IKN67_01465 [Alphaproteobacteria bacterium]|nr:hypothetical protein [Alphaproteobacteria bacterium]
MGFMFKCTIYACLVAVVYILMEGLSGEKSVSDSIVSDVSADINDSYDKAEDEIQDVIDNINENYIEPLQLQVQKM